MIDLIKRLLLCIEEKTLGKRCTEHPGERKSFDYPHDCCTYGFFMRLHAEHKERRQLEKQIQDERVAKAVARHCCCK